jgi:putative transposase
MDKGCSHTFSEIFLHVNFHCKYSSPLITEDVEPLLFSHIEEYFRKTRGVHLKAVGGTETHIHLAFQLEPFVTISTFVGKIKGASAYAINGAKGSGALVWQRGYGAVSVSPKDLPWVIKYVLGQKEHHRDAGTVSILEEVPMDEDDLSQDGYHPS